MNVLIYGDIQTAVNIIDIIIDMKMILKLQKCTFMNTASDKLKIRKLYTDTDSMWNSI